MEQASADDDPPQVIPKPAKRNAFTELMKPKPNAAPFDNDHRSMRTLYRGRDGLAEYTERPETFSSSRVIQYDDHFVVIRDMFPKASVHLLILPRNREKSIMRGQEAFEDAEFLEACKRKEREVRRLVASELRRVYGKHSATERRRIEAMEADEDAFVSQGGLPPGRNWDKEVKSGIHAIPSMNHLHIHVLSRDMVSDCMKKHNHYLSFNTDFLIPLDAFPLPENDTRRSYGHWQHDDLLCWRCGKNCGSGSSGMRVLKAHLEGEFDLWKRE